jgi:hypothetical protein
MGVDRVVCIILLKGGHYETFRVLMYPYLLRYGLCNDTVSVVDCVASGYELSSFLLVSYSTKIRVHVIRPELGASFR